MAYRILLLFLILVVSLPAGFAQNTNPNEWNLQQCIDYAMKTNLQLKQSELTTETSKLTLSQSQADRYPNLNAGASHTYDEGRTIDQYTNTFATNTVLSQNLYLSSSLILFNGMQKLNTVKENQLNYLSSKYDFEKAKNDVLINVTSNYLQTVLNQQLAEIAEAQLATSRKQLQNAEQLFQAGTIPKGTLLEMRAQVASDELNLTSANNQVELAYLVLTQYMNLDAAQHLKVVIPNDMPTAENLVVAVPDQIYVEALKRFPEIKSAELKVQSEEKKIQIARGMMSPQLSFNMSIGTGYSGLGQSLQSVNIDGYSTIGTTSTGLPVYAPNYVPVYTTDGFLKQYKDNVNSEISFRLNVPIFNGLQTSTAISKAKIARISADLALDQAKLQLRKNIQQACTDANASFRKFLATKVAVEANEESYKYNEQKFAVGALNATDLNLAKTKLYKSKSDLLQAQFELLFKTKILDFYKGKS